MSEPPPRVVLLVSPTAGSARKLPRARGRLERLGVQIVDEIEVTHHERLAHWLHQLHDRPLIVAAGGDGTVGAAAGYVASTGAVLGVLPIGTSNDFARSLGIPTSPLLAAELIATGKARAVDVGCFTPTSGPTRHFVHAATLGVNVNFAKLATDTSTRRRLGRLTYLAAGARALRDYRGLDCRLVWTDQRTSAGLGERAEQWRLVALSVINAPVFGGFLNLRVPEAHLDDGSLNVIAVERLSWRALAGIAAQSVAGTRRSVRAAHTFTAQKLWVAPAGHEPIEVALDGEPIGRLPGEFRVMRHGLRVIAPATPS